jgi:lambda repressor-like predicted transcriptional regulator
MTVYENIDKHIKARGISRRELARRAGIKETTLAACFARRPEHFPLKYGRAIAEVLDVDLDELYGYAAGDIMKSPQIATANAPVTKPTDGIPIEDVLALVKDMERQPPEDFSASLMEKQYEKSGDLQEALNIIDQRFGDGIGYVLLRFLKAYGQLNETGREHALQYIEDIGQIKRFQKEPAFKRVFPMD